MLTCFYDEYSGALLVGYLKHLTRFAATCIQYSTMIPENRHSVSEAFWDGGRKCYRISCMFTAMGVHEFYEVPLRNFKSAGQLQHLL